MGIISAACKWQRKGESSYASGTIPPDDKNEHAWLRTSVSIPWSNARIRFLSSRYFSFPSFFSLSILPAISKPKDWTDGRSLIYFSMRRVIGNGNKKKNIKRCKYPNLFKGIIPTMVKSSREKIWQTNGRGDRLPPLPLLSFLILTLGKRGTGLKNEFARRPSIHILLWWRVNDRNQNRID